ncbi:MAG: phosphoesterase [Deltaproteobacteria bacterium]|nr:phosphoesterase [Deltaproteobacteria bacterium]
MRLLFVTDLHGSIRKYEILLKEARAVRAQVVVNGGDMLPTEGDLFRQGDFIRTFLARHFEAYDHAGIHYLCFLGNDDLRIFDGLLAETAARCGYVHVLAQRWLSLGAFEFIGMNWVADYPFRLKDRCRRDTESFRFPPQYGSALVSTARGWKEIPDWFGYAAQLPSLAEELENLPQPRRWQDTVCIMHMPPAHLGLDVCQDGRRVGSQAIHDYLKAHQPLLSLHGHIHESPRMSGHWQAWLGKTLCLQPGQGAGLTYVAVDLATRECRRFVLPNVR